MLGATSALLWNAHLMGLAVELLGTLGIVAGLWVVARLCGGT